MFQDEIAALLVQRGVGVIDVTLLVGSKAVIPNGPGSILTLRDTGGAGFARTQNDTATEMCTMQLMTRAEQPQQALKQLREAYTVLGGPNGLYNITLSGVFYLSIKARQPITDTGLEPGTARASYAFNIEAEKEPS